MATRLNVEMLPQEVADMEWLGALNSPIYDVVKITRKMSDCAWENGHKHVIATYDSTNNSAAESRAEQYADTCNRCRSPYEREYTLFMVETHFNLFIGRATERRDCKECTK